MYWESHAKIGYIIFFIRGWKGTNAAPGYMKQQYVYRFSPTTKAISVITLSGVRNGVISNLECGTIWGVVISVTQSILGEIIHF